MVMSTISAVAAAVQLSLAVAAAAWDVYDLDYFGCYYFVGSYRPGSKVHVRCCVHFFVFTFCRDIFVTPLKRLPKEAPQG